MNLKRIILACVIFALLPLSGCSKTVKFGYLIKGKMNIITDRHDHTRSREEATNNTKGSFIFSSEKLKGMTFDFSNTKKDSVFKDETVNGKNSEYFMISNDSYNYSPVKLIKSRGSDMSYLFTGNVKSEILYVKNQSDSLRYTLKGNFNDTIMITTDDNKYALKMAYHVADAVFIKALKEKIKKYKNDILSVK